MSGLHWMTSSISRTDILHQRRTLNTGKAAIFRGSEWKIFVKMVAYLTIQFSMLLI